MYENMKRSRGENKYIIRYVRAGGNNYILF